MSHSVLRLMDLDKNIPKRKINNDHFLGIDPNMQA